MKKIFLLIGIIFLLSMAMQAQDIEKTQSKSKMISLMIKEGSEATIYIDGIKYDSEILELLDQTKIWSFMVMKGEAAQKKYGEEHVLFILTDKYREDESVKKRVKEAVRANGIPVSENEKGMEDAIIVIDGEIVSKSVFKNYSVDNIEKVNILKDEESLKKYNTKVGVIVVTTKAARKEEKKQKKQ